MLDFGAVSLLDVFIIVIPTGLIWMLLEIACEHFHISNRLAKRFDWRERKVRKWISRLNILLSCICYLCINIAIV